MDNSEASRASHLTGGQLPSAGEIIDSRFVIETEIGRGGMCVVFKARQTDIDRPAAIKFLQPKLLANEASVARFRTEAQAIARLQHPNIVEVFAVGKWGSMPYIAMEFLDGKSLASMLDSSGIISGSTAAPLVAQISTALSFAHSNGVIHRDLKPTNIMLSGSDSRTIKIVDFGIARVLDPETGERQKLTKSGTILGSVLYMSPEQCSGGEITPASDVYSLGCIAFEMLTGQPPFVGSTPYAIMMKHGDERPEYPNTVSEPVQAVITKALDKDPKRRPSATEFSRLFTDASQKRQSPIRFRIRPIPTASVIAFALVAGLAWHWYSSESATQAALANLERAGLRVEAAQALAPDITLHESDNVGKELKKKKLALLQEAEDIYKSIPHHEYDAVRTALELVQLEPEQRGPGVTEKHLVETQNLLDGIIKSDPMAFDRSKHLDLQMDLWNLHALQAGRTGNIRLAKNQYEKYFGVLDTHTMSRDPTQVASAHLNFGNSLFALGEWDAARKHLQSYVEYPQEIAYKERILAEIKIAKCYELLGIPKAAASQYQAVLNQTAFLEDPSTVMTDERKDLRAQRAAWQSSLEKLRANPQVRPQ